MGSRGGPHRHSSEPTSGSRLWAPTGFRSEGDHTLDHHAIELTTIPDVVDREVLVLLGHVLGLHQDRRGDEPACPDLDPIDADLVSDSSEFTLDYSVASTDIGALIGEEAVDEVTSVLGPIPVVDLGRTTTSSLLIDTEELHPTILDEGVELVSSYLARQTRVHPASPVVGASVGVRHSGV